MATRVNTRFLLVLLVVLFAVTGMVGGLWLIQYRKDATRNIRAGDEAVARGDYELAYKQYGKAVHKDPGNPETLDKLEVTLLKVRPATHDRAIELDIERVEILRHRCRYAPADPEVHLALLRELHAIARFARQGAQWQEVMDAAAEMDDQLAPDEPRRAWALLYRGLARTQMALLRSATQAEIDQARDDIRRFVEAFPDEDLGWAALVQVHLVAADRFRVQGNSARMTEELAQLREVAARAREAAPQGLETATMLAYQAAYVTARLDPGASDPDVLADAADVMVELVADCDDPHLLNEAVSLLQAAGLDRGWRHAIELLTGYLERQPEKHYHRLLLARLLYLDTRLDAAEAQAETVITSQQVFVSLLGRIQQRLRVLAAGLAVDVKYRRWELAAQEEKPQRLQDVQAAVSRLAGLITEPDREPVLLVAEGRLAFARLDFATAAARFERAVELTGGADPELLWYAANALEQIGQVGRALERVEAALARAPQFVPAIIAVARLSIRAGRYEEAEQAISELRAQDRVDVAQSLEQLMALRRVQGGETSAADALALALTDSDRAFGEGDVQTARSILRGQLDKEPANLLVLTRLVSVELRDDQPGQARQYLERALAIQPENRYLRGLERSLQNDDEVEALSLLLREWYADEGDYVAHLVYQFRRLAQFRESQATRLEKAGSTDEAARARSQAERAREAADEALARAHVLAPDHPLLLEYLFSEAIENESWADAERVVERAIATNADQARGELYRGRLSMARENYPAAVTAFTEATVRSGHTSMVWRLLGRAQEQSGNYFEARRSYEEAFRRNPADPIAVRWYVALLLRSGDTARALVVLRESHRAIPDDPAIMDQWLELEAVSGDLPLALERRRELYERTPGNRANALRLAALLGRAKPAREHILDDQGQPRYDAHKWQTLSAAERAERLADVKRGWRDEAQQIIDDVAASADETLAPTLAGLRAELLAERGEYAAGVQVLRDYAQSRTAPADVVRGMIAVAMFQAARRRLDDAVATLYDARRYQGEDREVERALAGLYFESGRWGEALDLYRQLERGDDVRAVRLREVECLMKMGRFDEADGMLAESIETGGRDFSTEMLTAAIAQGRAGALAAEGRAADAARQTALAADALARAERLDPQSVLPHLQRAQGFIQEYARSGRLALLDEAMRSLVRAEEIQPGSPVVSRLRVEVLHARGNRSGAVAEMTRLLERNPDDAGLRRLLIQMYIEDGALNAAFSVVDEAIARDPSDASWYEERGNLHVRRDELREAVKAYRDAHDREPTPARMVKFAEVAMRLPQPDYQHVVEVLVPDERVLEGKPVLRSMYARALGGVKRRDEALAHQRLAYREFSERIAAGTMEPAQREVWYWTSDSLFERPAEVEAFAREASGGGLGVEELRWLVGLFLARGPEAIDEAVKLQREVASAAANGGPDRAAALYTLGELLFLSGDHRGAADAFEQTLSFDPDHTAAMNNAAFLYAEHLEAPARALPLAERAAALLPGDANVLDTLGWTYYRLGRLEQAQARLRESVSARTSPDNLYHLAKVLVDSGELDGAEVYLRRAAELKPDRILQDRIGRLSDEIRRMRSPAAQQNQRSKTP
jgi:tetratricopeptide (TPR) repeat protein